MTVRVGGVQSLYDAIFVALMHRPEPDRRHLIVAITDGLELGSVVDSATVRDVARQTEAVLHLVFVDPVEPHRAARNRRDAGPAARPLRHAQLGARAHWGPTTSSCEQRGCT